MRVVTNGSDSTSGSSTLLYGCISGIKDGREYKAQTYYGKTQKSAASIQFMIYKMLASRRFLVFCMATVTAKTGKSLLMQFHPPFIIV